MTSPAPSPYEAFGGRIGRTVAGSESWWPPRAEPRPDAPNVVVVLIDDLGYSDLGCYGSEIATPNLDALAARGLRYTNFHVTPMCSPTRAALLTGCNPHRVGVGHVAHSDSGFPGYAMEISEHAATLAETYREAGYATYMVGKWHLTKDSHCSDAGPRDSWPCQRGFDRFYGILDGFTNLHQPHHLVEDNHTVAVDRYPDDYYFTDDITDRAIEMIKAGKASNPAKPFFCYVSHGAVHAPLHAKAADIERYADRYHGGWDLLRTERLARQRALGVVGPDVALPPRNSELGQEVPAWEDLPDDVRRLYARYMAVYAAMVDSVDQSFGRLRDELETMGELDNTIVCVTSDNGASREGEAEGTTAYYVHLLGDIDPAADLARLDEIGGPTTIPHYPRGWAMACNTPFRLYKINTHAGGHTVPMILSWPDRITARGELRTQYQHVTDLAPTLLELCGIEPLTERAGGALLTPDGTSLVPTIYDADAPSTHGSQHYEMLGHRGYYRDGWEIVTLHMPMTEIGDHEWECYDLRTDPTEIDDLAADEPERVAQLAAAWEQAARANQVYPIDEGSGLKYLLRPPWTEVLDGPVTIPPGTPTLERWRSQRLIQGRPFAIRIPCELDAADEGVLVAHGDQGGGYVVYVVDGALALAHNDGRGRTTVVDAGPLTPGPHEIEVAFAAPTDNRWTVTVTVDAEVRTVTEDLGYLFPMAPFEGIDIGVDRRSPVHWELWRERGPFPFTGRLGPVRYEPEPPTIPNDKVVEIVRSMGAKFE